MVQRSKGFRTRTRHILKKPVREKGMSPITRYLREFEEGARVAVKLDPASQAGMPHPRFQGHTGTIITKQGDAYTVQIRVGQKKKTLISRPEHLKRVA
ncbi:MAG: 50S ribosomal protein L21e [Euryarchaeota archaeon]|nr:50S ribosomal protein L21e [Euryarchaeota archaeon]